MAGWNERDKTCVIVTVDPLRGRCTHLVMEHKKKTRQRPLSTHAHEKAVCSLLMQSATCRRVLLIVDTISML